MQTRTNHIVQDNKPVATKKQTTTRPDGKPKVKMGTGKAVLFMSDTLFDDDLKE
ncbi:hypothetical protein [uncultured Spirosoma sp.]|uniref:hypothetical protein n=1 Tax=uncultured Spirosoma sp. TaxID=278208 RepID=UPI0025830B11|nr:hypothetical protein [uncultured Spirosoma sp.]